MTVLGRSSRFTLTFQTSPDHISSTRSAAEGGVVVTFGTNMCYGLDSLVFHTMIVSNLRMKNVLDVATVSLTSRCQSKRGKPSGHTGETLELSEPRHRVLTNSHVLVCASGNYASPTSLSTKRSRRVPTCPVHCFQGSCQGRRGRTFGVLRVRDPHKVGGSCEEIWTVRSVGLATGWRWLAREIPAGTRQLERHCARLAVAKGAANRQWSRCLASLVGLDWG